MKKLTVSYYHLTLKVVYKAGSQGKCGVEYRCVVCNVPHITGKGEILTPIF